MLPPPREVVTLLREMTPRETEVLHESEDGRPLQSIADALGVCLETIRTHRKSVLHEWQSITGQPQKGKKAFRTMRAYILPYLPPRPGRVSP
jgi:Bacterial regulatory proteins, luxR family